MNEHVNGPIDQVTATIDTALSDVVQRIADNPGQDPVAAALELLRHHPVQQALADQAAAHPEVLDHLAWFYDVAPTLDAARAALQERAVLLIKERFPHR